MALGRVINGILEEGMEGSNLLVGKYGADEWLVKRGCPKMYDTHFLWTGDPKSSAHRAKNRFY